MAQQGSPDAASDGRRPTPTLVVTLTLSRSPTPSPSPDEPPLAQQRAKVDETFRIEKQSTPNPNTLPAPKSAPPIEKPSTPPASKSALPIDKQSTPPAPKSASPTKPRPSPTMKTRSSTSSLPKRRRS
ncbi:hypothetical protein CF335_g9389 [Tilletia laevis]|nr:hypothetical protein CF335_g9389 [Tilletia laevis]